MFSTHCHVFWLFGLSGAGKSTMANELAVFLQTQNVPVLVLDGDNLRSGLCCDLVFSDADRTENLRRAAEVALLGAKSNLCVIASFITPHESQRGLIRRILNNCRLSMIYVDAPLEICRLRDVKGLYAKAEAGQIRQMTGIDSIFQQPTHQDLILPTAKESTAVTSSTLIRFARSRLGLAE